MKNKNHARLSLILGGILLLTFVLFTVLLKTVDLAPLPPNGTPLGLSAFNKAVFDALGTSDLAYDFSELLGLLIFVIPAVFGVLALVEWIKSKNLFRIDRDLWILFATYAVMIACYVLFEIVVINYRPVLIDGVCETSYPSSHTLLAVVICGTGLLQIVGRIKPLRARIPLLCVIVLLMLSVPILRLLSGVHWITDILAAILLGGSLVLLYNGFVQLLRKKNE